jgi:hypothetical protein
LLHWVARGLSMANMMYLCNVIKIHILSN